MRQYRVIIVTALISTLLTAMGQPSQAAEAASLDLKKPVHFLSLGGEDVIVPAGTHEVGSDESGQGIVFSRGEGQEPFILQAISFVHDEVVTTTVVRSESESEDEFVLIVLLVNGEGLEAHGSYSGIRARAAPATEVGKTYRPDPPDSYRNGSASRGRAIEDLIVGGIEVQFKQGTSWVKKPFGAPFTANTPYRLQISLGNREPRITWPSAGEVWKQDLKAKIKFTGFQTLGQGAPVDSSAIRFYDTDNYQNEVSTRVFSGFQWSTTYDRYTYSFPSDLQYKPSHAAMAFYVYFKVNKDINPAYNKMRFDVGIFASMHELENVHRTYWSD